MKLWSVLLLQMVRSILIFLQTLKRKEVDALQGYAHDSVNEAILFIIFLGIPF